MISISQATEYGTLYSLDDLRELSAFCRKHRLWLHMDGARIANAAAAMGVDLRTATRDAGVDILSFGGTKNGLMFGEAVVLCNPELAEDFAFYRKQGMQLGSKMRFMAAQFVAYLRNDLWLDNAIRANTMASLLAEHMRTIPGLVITRPVQINAVFARLPHTAVRLLLQSHNVAVWDESPDTDPAKPVDGPEIRIMTSFDTTEDEVRELAEAITAAMG